MAAPYEFLKVFSPMATVNFSGLIKKINGAKKSFQLFTNAKIITTKRTGFEFGRNIFQKIVNHPAPSILEDSTNSFGIASKNCFIRKIENAPPPVKAGTIKGR